MAEQHQVPLPEPPATMVPPPTAYGALGSEIPPAAPTTAQTARPVPETPPAYPPRPTQNIAPHQGVYQETFHQGALQEKPLQQSEYLPPPQRKTSDFGDAASPVHYIRDPHKLVAYLVPFPKPDIHKGFLHEADAADIPDRFLIYTPPPPPLTAPKEGEKEDRMHKLQRKWQQEVRSAKTSDAKITSWKGVKGRATKGINAAMGWTTTSSLDFLNRVPADSKSKAGSTSGRTTPDTHAEDGHQEGDQTNKTVGLEELILIYPSSVPGNEAQIREEFVNSMLRSKSKAQKDAIIATGLIPVSLAIDVLATLIWPFGGLLEIDTVWAYSSIRGAKTARSVTKRLHSSSPNDAAHDDAKLKLVFTPSQRLEVLRRYLAAECHKRDPKLFKPEGLAPTESEVLEAIGWSPSQIGGETRNWEDEQWEVSEVKDDLRLTMGKGGKEWDKWCKAFQKDPEKALKK
jgi:hypothetical protein